MKIYDDTQHHKGIDLEGNDINKAKFPRIERDGLFIDEVRSNPTTGLLEIWDGTQWLGYIDTGTLPEGTVNQTLRHNGTEWVSTSRITNVENETGSAFTISSPNVSQIASRAGTSSSYIDLKHDDNGVHIYSYVSGSEQILRISPSGTAADRLQLRTTTTYMPDEIMIRHKNFNVYQNGKVQSSNLAGTGTARAVIDSNGVFMRDETIAVTPLQSIVFDKLITTPSTMVEITAAELGIDISQDILLDKLVSFEAYFYDEYNRSMSTVDIRAKVATRDTVAIDLAQQYPAGTRVRVLLILR